MLHSNLSPPPFTHLSEIFGWPDLFTVVATIKVLKAHIEAIGEGNQKTEYPYDWDYAEASGQLHAGLEGVDDDEETIDSDGRQGECGDVDTGPLGVGHGMAQCISKYPLAW